MCLVGVVTGGCHLFVSAHDLTEACSFIGTVQLVSNRIDLNASQELPQMSREMLLAGAPVLAAPVA